MAFNLKKHLPKQEKIVYKNNFVYVTEEKKKGFNFPFVRVYFEPSVHIFPVSKNGKIWLIKEHRVSENITKWTLPGGSLEKNQTPRQCALAELQEELGYTAKKMDLFCKMLYKNKASNELRYYFIARNLEYNPVKNPDGDVILDKKEFSINTLKKMVINGEFDWSQVAFAILKLAREIKSGKIKL